MQSTTAKTEHVAVKRAPGRDCLLVMLNPVLLLARVEGWPFNAFTCEGRRYRDAGFGEWTDFYDWLRNPDSNVIGVRYWLNAQTEFLSDVVNTLPYVQATPPRHLEIFFSQQREISESRSCDQDFLYDPVFVAEGGSYAIGFGMGGLTQTDYDSLTRLSVKWTEVEDILNL